MSDEEFAAMHRCLFSLASHVLDMNIDPFLLRISQGQVNRMPAGSVETAKRIGQAARRFRKELEGIRGSQQGSGT